MCLATEGNIQRGWTSPLPQPPAPTPFCILGRFCAPSIGCSWKPFLQVSGEVFGEHFRLLPKNLWPRGSGEFIFPDNPTLTLDAPSNILSADGSDTLLAPGHLWEGEDPERRLWLFVPVQ